MNNSKQPGTESKKSRRTFLSGAVLTVGAVCVPDFLCAANSARPSITFPSDPRQRISVCSYPFREFIAGNRHKDGNPSMDLKEFAAHVVEKFQVKNIEPWTGHFPSTEPQYLEDFRKAVEQAGSGIVNIAVDTRDSPYAASIEERQRAIVHSKKWIVAAVTLGSPSIRTNITRAKDAKPDVNLVAESLRQVVDYASSRNIVVHLENDDEISEGPRRSIRADREAGGRNNPLSFMNTREVSLSAKHEI